MKEIIRIGNSYRVVWNIGISPAGSLKVKPPPYPLSISVCELSSESMEVGTMTTSASSSSNTYLSTRRRYRLVSLNWKEKKSSFVIPHLFCVPSLNLVCKSSASASAAASSTLSVVEHEREEENVPREVSVPSKTKRGGGGGGEGRGRIPNLDKYGRFSSPRAGRELALLVLYASCLEGSDPVRLLDKWLNLKIEPGTFDRGCLLEYDHWSYSGDPIVAQTDEEEKELLKKNKRDHLNEAAVLSAPPRLVYNRHVIRFSKNLLEAVLGQWDHHVMVISKVTPSGWKDEPGGRILELCILHLAMAEIAVVKTRHQIVINEAVDLSKRFCDGSAPRIINGCLRTFIQKHAQKEVTIPS